MYLFIALRMFFSSFVIDNLGVYLSRFKTSVSEHFAGRLDGHAISVGHRRGKCVAGKVESK